LSKAFESLFGSVSCLPGYSSLYRTRNADKGRPIIISNRIIDEYAEGNVVTLHKKDLFSFGEGHFMMMLLLKHFPTFKTKSIPDSVTHTMTPSTNHPLDPNNAQDTGDPVDHPAGTELVSRALSPFCQWKLKFPSPQEIPEQYLGIFHQRRRHPCGADISSK